MVISIITWVIFGALAGWIASMIMGTNARQGALGNIMVGIAGAFIGGLIVQLLGGDGMTGFNLYSLLVAIGGAVVLLWITRGFGGRRSQA